MSGEINSTVIESEVVTFDLAGILGVIEDKLWLVLVIAFIVFMFWIFQKGGFAEKLLDSRQRQRELEAKKLENLRHISDKLSRKYDGDEPFLPLPDFSERGKKP